MQNRFDKKKEKILRFENNLTPFNWITGDNDIDFKISIVVGMSTRVFRL